jgi:hypothetical protein
MRLFSEMVNHQGYPRVTGEVRMADEGQDNQNVALPVP